MKKFITILMILILVLAMSACGDSDNIEGVYADGITDGYQFNSDGTVQYYKVNWGKPKDMPMYCNPEYGVGTYKIDDKAVTVTISGGRSS